MKKPEKLKGNTGFTITYREGYNQACEEWEKYHQEIVNDLVANITELQQQQNSLSGNCGGGWTYNPLRDCFTNQMGDIR